MGNSNSGLFGFSLPLSKPTPPPSPPLPTVNNTDKYNIPANSGTIDVDVQNLQKCMTVSGNSLQSANTCITNYVQGYDTNNNTFTPIKLSQIQNFEMLDNQKSFINPLIYIVIVILYLIIMFK